MVHRLTRTRKAQNKHTGWDGFIVFSEAWSNNCQLLGTEREREGEGWGREEERKIRDSHLHWNCYLPLKIAFSPRPHISIMRLSGNLALINGLGYCWLNCVKATGFVSCLLPKLCCTEMRMVRKERPSQGFWVKLGCHSPYFTLIIQMIMCREVRGKRVSRWPSCLEEKIQWMRGIFRRIVTPFFRRENETKQMRKCLRLGNHYGI